jgi:RNA polymerase sigma factor (sigma-70 family)
MVVGVVRDRDAGVAEDTAWGHVRSEDELSHLVSAAAAGSSDAWRALFARFSNMVLAIARSCRLNDADVSEVHQVTWLRMVENIGRIEQPERIGAWLATTAKRESLRVVRKKGRVTLDHDGLLLRADTKTKPVDAGPIEEERMLAVRTAFELLPPHCQRLLSLMSGDEPPSYKEISQALSMPIGSIGPTRGRCLDHLRRILREIEPEV